MANRRMEGATRRSAKDKPKMFGNWKTYSFADKDPIIDKLRTIFQLEGKSYAEVAALSGCSESTYRNWFDGDVRRPIFATTAATARALGYELSFVKQSTGRVYKFKNGG